MRSPLELAWTRGCCLGALAIIGLFPAAATAEHRTRLDRWAVLVHVTSASEPRFAATLVESVHRAAEYRLGLEVLSPEEAFVDGGQGLQSALSSCGADALCLAERVEPARVDYALVLVERAADQGSVFALRVIDSESKSILHQSVALASAPGEVPTVVSRLASEAFQALKYLEGGRLVARIEPPDASLTILDAVTGERRSVPPPGELLPPGSFVLEVELEGYRPQHASVEIRPATETRVDVDLAPQRSLSSSPWFWIATGLAAVAVGVGVGLAVAGRDDCFCAAEDPATCQSCP